MKKTIATLLLAATLMLTACSNSSNKTGTPISETTMETTTEVTVTTTTTEATTTETQISPENFVFDNGVHASDFDFGDYSIGEHKNADGVKVGNALNYPEGKDIIISFKCSADLKGISIIRNKYMLSSNDPDFSMIVTSPSRANKAKIPVSECLKNSDGVYSIKIPGECVEPNTVFYVKLSQEEGEPPLSNTKGISFNVYCIP